MWFTEWYRTQRVVDALFTREDGRRPPRRFTSLAYAARLAASARLGNFRGGRSCLACREILGRSLAEHQCHVDLAPAPTQARIGLDNRTDSRSRWR